MQKIFMSVDELTNGRFTGIERYIYETTTAIDKQLSKSSCLFQLYLCYPFDKKIKLPKLENLTVYPIETSKKPFRTCVLSRIARENNAWVCFMSPTICTYSKSIITIHDARPLESFSMDSLDIKAVQRLIGLSIALNKNAKVVTVSEFQKKRISKLYGIKSERFRVIGNGWEHILSCGYDDSIFDRMPSINRGEYYLSVGSVAPHKNYEWIYNIAKKYPENKFVIAGNISKDSWNYDDSKLQRSNIFFTGYLTDEQCKSLMVGCKALIHPAKYEGFGIPPLEALALEKKIYLAKSSCLPEIYGDSACYFEPNDYEYSFSNSVWNSESRKKVLYKNSWEQSAVKWIDLFNSVVEE